MRVIIIIILFISTLSIFGQDYKIENIYYKPDSFKFDYNPISYPIIKLSDPSIIDNINPEIKKATLDNILADYDTTIIDILSGIKFLMSKSFLTGKQLNGFNYSIVFNQGELITIETDYEICDRAVWHIKNQFNIDVKHGKVLTIEDIVNNGKQVELEKILRDYKNDWLISSQKEIQKATAGEQDGRIVQTYKCGIDEIKSCLNRTYKITSFLIENNFIIFYDECEFSSAVENNCPFSTMLPLNQKDKLKGIIKDEYYNLIYEK